MRKKLVKLTLALSILVGGLEMGVAVREAQACPAYYCCDQFCSSIRKCFRVGGSCICEANCSVGGIDPGIQ
ncbi:MAG TPA: hypothetical protein VHN15_10515 [Thermoanaerobaculia bacterium]|nr:hypothetical protein [Thermoanaerobaculia bacterium]